MADLGNLCWYWECVEITDDSMALLPRRCALGSKMAYAYQVGSSNPCQVNFNTQIDYECTRADDFIAPVVSNFI